MAKQQKANTVNMHGGIYINNIEHIEHFHAPTDNSTDQSTTNTQVNNAIAADPLSAEVLRPYIDLGLIDEQLMPTEKLSNGQKGMMAHDIATRLKMQNFWPLFEQMWQVKHLRTYYNQFCKTNKSVQFMKLLNQIK